MFSNNLPTEPACYYGATSWEGFCDWLLHLFDLIAGFFFLWMSFVLGFYGLPLNLVGFGVFIITFTLGLIFIYEGAKEPTPPRAVATKVEIRPQNPQNQLVKVTYAPTTELVVHEVVEQDQTEFFEDIVRQMLASPAKIEPIISWVDGFALAITQFPPADEVVAGNLTGTTHYQTVAFTRMPFHSKVNMKLGDQDFSVRLRKADNNPNLVDLALFLKGFHRGASSYPLEPTAVLSVA